MSVRVPLLFLALSLSAIAPSSAQNARPPAATAPAATQPADALARARTPLSEIRGVEAADAASQSADHEKADAKVQAMIDTARAALEDGENDEAANLLIEAIRSESVEHAEPRRLLAIALERRGLLEPALRYAEAAAALDPRSVDGQALVGGLLLRAGRHAAALPHLRSATLAAKDQPDNPNVTYAWFALGECLRQGGYALAAEEAYAEFDRTVFETHPEQVNAERVKPILGDLPRGALFRRAELLKQLSRDDDLDRLLRGAMERWPDDVSVAQSRARALLDAGRAKDALEFARARLTDRASSGMFLPIAVEAAARATALDAWLDEIADAARGGESPSYAAEMVQLLNRQRSGEAAARLGEILVAAGGPPHLRWDIAIGHVIAGKLGAGVDIVAAIVRDLPPGRDLPEARIREWCAAVARAGDFAARLADVRGRAPADFAVDFVLGMTAAGVNEPSLADELLSASMRARPDFAPALTVRGRILLSRHQWDEAKAEARDLLKTQPDLAAAWVILADAHDGLDENDEAVEAYKKAISLAPDEPLYRLAIARHFWRLEMQLAVQRYFAEALELDPLCAEAHEGLVESYIRDGKIELAKAHWREMQLWTLPDDVMRRVGTTLRFFESGRLYTPDHIAEMARQLADHPGDAVVARYLAASLAAQGRLDEAAKVCGEALARAPGDFHLLMVQSDLHLRDVQFDKSAALLEGLVKQFPNRVALLARLATAYRYDFRTDEARAIFRRLAERPGEPRNNLFASMLYQSYVEFGDFAEANRLLDSMLEETPDDLRLLDLKLRNMVQIDQREAAFDIAAARLAAAPEDESVRDLYLSTTMLVERFAEAEAKAREWMKDDVEGFYGEKLVDVLIRSKKFEEAMAAAKKFPDTSWPLALRRRHLMARIERAAGRLTPALSEFEGIMEARAIGGVFQRGLQSEILSILCEDRQYDAALARCEKWLKSAGSAPEDRLPYFEMKLDVLRLAGREEEYLDQLEALWRLDPAKPTYCNDLGYAWVDLGRNVEQATAMIRKAVAAEPMIHAYLDSLGWAYYKAGDFAGAKKYLERSSKLLTGHDPDVLDHLGDAEWRLGENDAAVKHWSEAAKLLEAIPESEKSAPDKVKLLASVRAKLAAVESRQPPPVAALAERDGGSDR